MEAREDLVARIDAPRLNYFHVTLCNQFHFDTPQLVQFISRTPTLKAHDEAHAIIYGGVVMVILLLPTAGHDLGLDIFFRDSDFQFSSLPRAIPPLHSLSMVESLYIYVTCYMRLDWENAIRVKWLDLLRPYTAVRNLYLSKVSGPGVVHALQGSVGGRTTAVLPTLQTVFLEGLQSGPVQEDIGQFVAARQLSSFPCAVSLWNGAGDF